MSHFGLTARQQTSHDPSGCGMETCSPKSWFSSWGWDLHSPSLLGGWGEEMVLCDISWVSHIFQQQICFSRDRKMKEVTPNYTLWGNLLFYFLICSLTSGKSLLANTKLTLLPKGASLNYWSRVHRTAKGGILNKGSIDTLEVEEDMEDTPLIYLFLFCSVILICCFQLPLHPALYGITWFCFQIVGDKVTSLLIYMHCAYP